MSDFSGWTPSRIFWQDSRPTVDWAYLGKRRFTDPFFGQTINLCLRHPADLLFRHQTPLDELERISALHPSAPPRGFIFHMSRCGSTLVSQMLAALPQNIMLSEAGPIDEILRLRSQNPAFTEEQQLRWLRWMVSTLAWRRHPAEQNVFIKFDCWHTMFLPLIRRAFPGVPWVFLYREPVEVMASAQKVLGGQMIPGVLDPRIFGLEPALLGQMPIYEYAARALAKICEAALAQVEAGQGKLINYRQLPALVWPALMQHWSLEYTEDETAGMFEAAGMDAKNPALPFAPDSQAKRESILPELRALADKWLGDVYGRLEARRQASGFA